MPVRSHRLPAAAVLLAMLSLVLLLYGLGGAVPSVPVGAPNGTADLTGFDFSSSVAHIADADFYAGRLLSPSEIEDAAPDGGFDKTARYYTIRLRFLVPDGEYMIFGLSPEYASEIYINGILAETFGRIDPSDEKNNVYRVAPFSAAARPAGGVIELSARSAGIIRDDVSYRGFFIGSYNTANYRRLCDTVYHLIPVVVAGMCALFYFGYFIFAPSVKANLWFALISLTTGFLLFGSEGFSHALLPNLGYRLEFRAANISLLMICVLYSLFARSLYGIPKAAAAAVCAGGGLLSVLILCLPVRIAARYLVIHVCFIFAVMAVCTVLILRAGRFNTEQAISFCGQAAFMACGIFDLLGSAGVIRYYELTTIGILIFIFAQMTALYLVNGRAVQNERRLEAENRALEKLNSMKTELLGNIAHELKTPVTVISNVSQLAARHTGDGYVREKMNTAISEIGRMKLKLRQLMELARVEDAEIRWDIRPVDIGAVIADTAREYFQTIDENGNTLSVELPEELPGVMADPAHIPGVLINLLDNAARFTRDGVITVRAARDGDFVKVSVEDTGCGIPAGQEERIFDRFYTGEKSAGTGLGLHICKKVVEAHGGSIRAQSAPGRGAAVSFTLPLCEEDF
ncbi:MAG: sensor histidine kinase [Oscillospiraceae bacterium]|nr:sensor histidine kinase [Oscillospiraceae bacterium]